MFCVSAEGEVAFEVLHVLSFDSNRKRMSVIVKHPMSKEIILYTKGADSAVLSILAKKYKGEYIMGMFNKSLSMGIWEKALSAAIQIT